MLLRKSTLIRLKSIASSKTSNFLARDAFTIIKLLGLDQTYSGSTEPTERNRVGWFTTFQLLANPNSHNYPLRQNILAFFPEFAFHRDRLLAEPNCGMRGIYQYVDGRSRVLKLGNWLPRIDHYGGEMAVYQMIPFQTFIDSMQDQEVLDLTALNSSRSAFVQDFCSAADRLLAEGASKTT